MGEPLYYVDEEDGCVRFSPLNMSVMERDSEMSEVEIVEHLNKGNADIATLRAEIATLKSQLPVEMPECFIVFHTCPKGHGRLSATNWVASRCSTCEIATLTERAEAAEQKVADAEWVAVNLPSSVFGDAVMEAWAAADAGHEGAPAFWAGLHNAKELADTDA